MVSGDKAGWAGWHDKLLGRKTVEQLIELALSSDHYCTTLWRFIRARWYGHEKGTMGVAYVALTQNCTHKLIVVHCLCLVRVSTP